MSVNIDRGVFDLWEQRFAEFDEPGITLRLRSAAPEEGLLRVLRRVSLRVEEAYGPGPDRDGVVDERRSGAWRPLLTPNGVLLSVDEEPDDFRGALEAIAAGLEDEGIEGHFEVFEPPSVTEPPVTMPLVEARLRPVGKPDAPTVYWTPDCELFWELVRAGARWCVTAADRASLTLRVGPAPRAAVKSIDDLDELLRRAIESFDADESELAVVTARGFRVMGFSLRQGRVSLVQGSDEMMTEGWKQATAEMTTLIKEHDELLVYGFVKHGSFVNAAALGYSLGSDWPRRPGYLPDTGLSERVEDTRVPDAFAIQLLGPGYHDVPAGLDWRATSLGAGRVLLEHRRPAEWFEIPFAPRGGNRNARSPPLTPPDVLANARADFAAILF
jgi:hypothetical protein